MTTNKYFLHASNKLLLNTQRNENDMYGEVPKKQLEFDKRGDLEFVNMAFIIKKLLFW